MKLDCRKTNTIPRKLEIRKQKSEKLEELWSDARALSRFLSLRNEVWLLILKNLSARDLLALGLSCQKGHELSEEPILWKNLYKDAKKTPVLFDFGENWKAASALVKDCAQNNSSLTLQRELDKLQDENSQIESENKKATATLTQLRSTLDFLSHSDANSPVTATEEIIFRNILRKKEVLSTNDLIEAKNPRGRSKFLQTVRMVEVPSNEATSRTLRERSRSNEKLVTLTSTSKANTDKDKDNTSKMTQIAHLMRRDKSLYTASAERANLKILAKFTAEQAASLKRELSFEQWRVIKRLLTDGAGRDIVGSENNLRNFLKENNHHEYEAGSFTSKLSNKVTFVRITNLSAVVKDTVATLNEAGEMRNVGSTTYNTLQLLYCADKGSWQTKLLFTALHSKLKHSINRAKLLAIFDCEKDTRECVEMVCVNNTNT